MIPSGRRFFKMTGSGNDFVMVDARHEPPGALADPERIAALCARGTGVGADGIVFLEPSAVAALKLTYRNADGSLADFCGNATLCTTRLAVELGVADAGGFAIETDAGIIPVRIAGGLPEADLPAVADVRPQFAGIALGPGESAIGFALAGVPHLVVRCADVSTVDVVARGRPLRSDRSLPQGANVNFVSARPSGWRVRTYERGVEGETLACGSGAVATGVLLASWGAAETPIQIETRSGRVLTVMLRRSGAAWLPSLRGEGRVVFEGILSEI
jgi:diaminopimelate epimerase